MNIILTIGVVVLTLTATYVLGLQVRLRVAQEQLDYYTLRDQVGDFTVDQGSHDTSEVDLLRRRMAGLLASPKLYLRARRIVAPLTLDRDELTAELELIETT